MKRFSFIKQHDAMDCGPTCLKMIARFHGRNYSLITLRSFCEVNQSGTSLLGLSRAAEKIGFRTLAAKITLQQIKEVELPIILHWNQSHFIVLLETRKDTFKIADPAIGIVTLSGKDFKKRFLNKEGNGIALLMEITPEFYELEEDKNVKISWSFIFKYFKQHRQLVAQLFMGLAVGTLLQLVAPFLTQSIIDIGINTHNLNFIYIILFAQIALIIGRSSVEFIRSWILFHISTRISLSILTDFLIKLMKLPMVFFDSKKTGDIFQRIADQARIESFLTGTTLGIVFSFVNLIIFSVVLMYYNAAIFGIFCISSVLLIMWLLLFLRQRSVLDYKHFDVSADSQSTMLQLVTGMQEIKLNNCERQKRWEWERIQAKLFAINIKGLALRQYQSAGMIIINESSNMIITFLSAKSVIEGQLTFGGMLAIQYILGQLNNPISQLLSFITALQDTRISLERLNEVQQIESEEPKGAIFIPELPKDKSLRLNNVSFRYPGTENDYVLKGIDLEIPEGQTTAIVGMSGSGKTTILKLLLRFYTPQEGHIAISKNKLDNISLNSWRDACGTVMQDGFIFSDTIANNITLYDEHPNEDKLDRALKIANIEEFIENLPLGMRTKIGAGGNGISQGQRQRILIARAVYKDPTYILLDEATNALDANNEKVIMDNLIDFFRGRTVVIVAHRLSTVKNADNIVVLEYGKIIEQGTHSALTTLKGKYFQLVKNQLELAL